MIDEPRAPLGAEPPGDGAAAAGLSPGLAPHHHPDLRERLAEERERLIERQRRANARSGRNLGIAIAIGLAIGIALILSLVIAKPLFVLFGMAMVGLGTAELASAMRVSGRDVPRIPTVLFGTAVVPAAYFGGPIALWIGLCAAILAVSCWRAVEALLARPRPSAADVRRDLLAGAFIQLYVTFLGSFTVLLAAQPAGELWVLGFIIPVVAIDTGALATGVRFGRTKLAPSISGGKTWEGLVGGAAWGIIASVLVCIFLLGLPWWMGFVIGPVLLLTATLGDLFESMVKRDLGVKDMSSWVPGHGGILDRLDSILPSGAIMFALCFVIGAAAGR